MNAEGNDSHLKAENIGFTIKNGVVTAITMSEKDSANYSEDDNKVAKGTTVTGVVMRDNTTTTTTSTTTTATTTTSDTTTITDTTTTTAATTTKKITTTKKTTAKSTDSPKTGDVGAVVPALVLAMAAAGAFALRRKREDEE